MHRPVDRRRVSTEQARKMTRRLPVGGTRVTALPQYVKAAKLYEAIRDRRCGE